MKKLHIYAFSIIVLAVSFMSKIVNGQKSCALMIPTTTNVIEGNNILPGDTICINGGLRSYLLFKNIIGTSSQPIVIINRNSKSIIDTDHFYGVKFSGCRHIKFIGTSSENQPYGIKINRVGNGAGISVDDLSTNIEIAHIEIANTALGGIYAKTDPNCTFVATRDKFTMYNLSIHDCYLHDIEDEGFYVGSSKFTGQYLPDCDTTVLPHFIHGVNIYNNIIERTGWDGIQVSSSPENCRIFNNIIRNDSYRETHNQMSGILIGGGSNCDCYNNQIFDGKGDGIDVFGFGTMKLYNNLIVRAGKSYQPENSSAARHGIFIGNSPDGAPAVLHLMHNSIINPKTNGIRFFNSNTSNNLIFNNIITSPGDFSTIGNRAYFNSDFQQNIFSIRNNLFTEQPTEIQFMNLSSDNYDLKPSSPAVNTGFFAGLNAVSYDLLNRPRPHNSGYDIGAFESQDPFADLHETNQINPVKVFPVPASEKVTLSLDLSKDQLIQFKVTTIDGKLIYSKEHYSGNSSETKLEFNVNKWNSGIYIYSVQYESGIVKGIFSVIK
jgi:hypothetical protein